MVSFVPATATVRMKARQENEAMATMHSEMHSLPAIAFKMAEMGHAFKSGTRNGQVASAAGSGSKQSTGRQDIRTVTCFHASASVCYDLKA